MRRIEENKWQAERNKLSKLTSVSGKRIRNRTRCGTSYVPTCEKVFKDENWQTGETGAMLFNDDGDEKNDFSKDAKDFHDCEWRNYLKKLFSTVAFRICMFFISLKALVLIQIQSDDFSLRICLIRYHFVYCLFVFKNLSAEQTFFSLLFIIPDCWEKDREWKMWNCTTNVE